MRITKSEMVWGDGGAGGALNAKKASGCGRLFRKVRVFGRYCLSGRTGYEEPLAARKVRLRVSGAQAIDTIMPISSTAANTIIV
ncbi:hypothetical protein SAMN05414139_06015 [Burkholderia sp. D7]|nr:hypothetical protein SAMN05414139_06015 [Burkholderia sp. D7]